MKSTIFENGYLRIGTIVPEVYIGNIEKNSNIIIEYVKKSIDKNIDILVFPELSLTSYSAEDLFFNRGFIDKTKEYINYIEQIILEYAKDKKNMIYTFGAPIEKGNKLYNCIVVTSTKDGILGFIPKTNIINNNDYYEGRWFVSSNNNMDSEINFYNKKINFTENFIINLINYSNKEISIAFEVGNDLENIFPNSISHVMNGADLIINCGSSIKTIGSIEKQVDIIKEHSRKNSCGYIFVSAGTTESTKDFLHSGQTIIALNGKLLLNKNIENEIICTDIDCEIVKNNKKRYDYIYDTVFYGKNYKKIDIKWENNELMKNLIGNINKEPFYNNCNSIQEVLDIQSKGLETRLKKIGVKNVVIGISGGLDSTLALLVCVNTFKNLNLDLKGINAITMPCFGTSSRTLNNSLKLMTELGVTAININIEKAVLQHFEDINHDKNIYDITYENSQARERTQVLMDYANKVNGIVIGTGTLSEIYLGWMTYNGDHMSMYSVNSGIPKTMVKHIIKEATKNNNEIVKEIIKDIFDTGISPELLPKKDENSLSQQTEKIIGDYILHDFFIYNYFVNRYSITKIFYLGLNSFKGEYNSDEIVKVLEIFVKRVFTNQFKRNAMPDTIKVFDIGVSSRTTLKLASEIDIKTLLDEIHNLK